MLAWFDCSAACIVAAVSPSLQQAPHVKLVRTTFERLRERRELANACDAGEWR